MNWRGVFSACRAAGLLATLLCGCDGSSGPRGPERASRTTPPADSFHLAPLPVQQARAYPETVTGLFVSLADFEAVGGDSAAAAGADQASSFRLDPDDGKSLRRFVVNVTRTGAGALEVRLAPRARLVFSLAGVHDFSTYSLLSLAVHSRRLRDDFRVTLKTDGALWSSHRTLLKPGWNNVLIDIQRLKHVRGFDLTGVQTLTIDFPDARGQVWFHVDDILLINNQRLITPSFSSLGFRKTGLDYVLRPEDWLEPVRLAQEADGLWRLGVHQPVVQLAGPGNRPPHGGEDLALMGSRKVGRAEVLEHNAIRVRIANVWYFPTRAGEWASLDGVRRLRWEYTFYRLGRWVTHIELNNAGGREIRSVRIQWRQPVRPAGAAVDKSVLEKKFEGIVERWSCLQAPATPAGAAAREAYGRPGRLRLSLAATDAFARGDADRDRFDESQGCYFLRAVKGQCRFTIVPPPGGLPGGVFRIAGRWAGAVHVNSEGFTIRDTVRLADGGVLFALPGPIRRPTRVEVRGRWSGPVR